ncbi:uncharacterized protein FIBRA_08289 [Fibroporia radiculosa]|uniref:CID domain-containing protein n=1 Tax=Fibroporia radiculosa TaxID=599839 RepID=J4GH12_9APHY|nr:uncharacterized protein FIBRA_08289 [Fibroporia radiculosa]CCM06043.1 predicted protein [Fibroporia radiculosa]
MSSSLVSQSCFLEQIIVPAFSRRICLRRFSNGHTSTAVEAIQQLEPDILGVSIQLANDGTIDAIALATGDRVFLLSIEDGSPGKFAALNALFAGPLLATFRMADVALQICYHLGFHCRGVELGTLIPAPEPWSPSRFVDVRVTPGINRHPINAVWHGLGDTNLCLRAWLSVKLAEESRSYVESAAKVNTAVIDAAELRCLGRWVTNIQLLEMAKPDQMENEFDDIELVDGNIVLRNSRFKTRVRRSEQTSVVLDTEDGKTIYGQAIRAEGKSTTIKVTEGRFRRGIGSIRVVGREEPTNAERARDEFILRVLYGEASLSRSLLIQMLWFPSALGPAQCNITQKSTPENISTERELNASQARVVESMISLTSPLVIVHGPPGTGKTKTISSATHVWQEKGQPVWVVAQSNVGVKNIAASFHKHRIGFKLIVSKEFYVEWYTFCPRPFYCKKSLKDSMTTRHEHIYGPIEKYLIRSDDLFRCDPVEMERMLGSSHVILCTLGMMSNPALDDCRIYKFVPVERLVVDEASQIDTFEFMHLLYKFKKLHKLCFFGDPKQLPPFGKDNAPDIQTIFDLKHLKPQAHFLDTQYRMPAPLGNFISHNVYNSKLRSVHRIKDASCIVFVDVAKGTEAKSGNSWINMEEVHAAVNLVRHYYQKMRFCIITPYDAQRGAIQRQLKAEKLPWECHEEEFVIVSTVRTGGPGFLRSQARTNVMLTRCTAGMVIVTNRQFFNNGGRDTLLGKLAEYWVGIRGREATWTSPMLIAGRTAKLPKFRTGTVPISTAAPKLPVTALAQPKTSIPPTLSMQKLSINSSDTSVVRYHTPQGAFPPLPGASSRSSGSSGKWFSRRGRGSVLPAAIGPSCPRGSDTPWRKDMVASIQKVVGYALKYFSGCGEDLWDCIVEECQKGSINNRINILYLLDSLCETSLLAKSHQGHVGQDGAQTSFYVDYVARDLGKIVEYVVPEGRQGLPNLMSTKQILESWRSKRVLDPQKVDDVMATLDTRRASLEQEQQADNTASRERTTTLARGEVFKRIEEDRERHKRLRERRWVQPVSHNPHTHLPPQLASFLPLTDDGDGEGELTLDIEFENDWETTSDWNEDDDEAAADENHLCFPSNDGEQEMDLS